MGTFSDVAELRIKILGDGAQKDMKTLKMSAKDIKDELLLMENAGLKNSKVYKDMKTLLSDVNMAAKSTLVNFDLQNASMTEMRAKKAALNAELNKLVVGSKEWMAKMGEIAPIAEKINQTREQINNFGKSVEVQESIWSKYGDWIKGAFAVTGIMELWQMLKGFAAGSLEEAKKFESAAQSLRGEVTMTDEQFKALKKSAEENGEAFGMTGEEMLKAYNAIASGKSDLIDVKGGIEAVTDAAIRLATNGEMELEESAKVMTSSLNQFGAEAKDAAKFVDILSTGTIVGAGKIQEMGSALKYVGPMAKAAGLSFSETNAALQILHQNGIKGEQAGTALRGMLSKLLKGANDTNPSIVGMSTAFDNLAKKQLSAKDMTELFGQEAVSAGIAIVSNNVKLKEWTATIEKGGGAAAMYAEKTKTVEFAEKQAAAAYANSRREIGEKLLPIWVSLINFFTQYGIPSIKAVATGIIGLIQGLAALPKFIVENKELFIGLGVALVSLNGANIAAAASALYMAAAEKTRAIATRAGVAAQWLMNAALTANPIGLVIAAIATLTGGIVWAYKNVNWFRAGIQATWAGLKEFVKVIWDVNMAFYKLDFSKAWERLKNGWSSVSKASGDAYSSAMAESNKRVAADTDKTNTATGKKTVDNKKKTAAEIAAIEKKAGEDKIKALEEQLARERNSTGKHDTQTAKERKAAADKLAKDLVNAQKDMLEEIAKANQMADKTIRKSLADNMKAKITSNKAELDASEKLRKELMDNALKMALFKDSLEKVERIKKAKSLKEIEEIEIEYKDKALKRELEYSKIFLERKEKEFKDLKKLGAFTKEEEDKRAKELLELRQDVADKELAILKKSIADKQDELKDDKAIIDEMWEQEVKAYKEKEEKKAALKAEIIKQFGDEAKRLTNEFLQNAISYYQKEVDAADGAMKKFFAQQKLNSAKNTANVISGAMDIASGNYVAGSIKIVTGIVNFFDQEFNAYAKALEARAAATSERIKRNLDALLPRLQATIAGLEDIESVYKKVGEDPFMGVADSLSKLNEIYSTLLANHLSGIDKMTERANNSALALVDAEIKIGEHIISNWELATDKQNELYEEKKSLIQQTYDDEIAKINQKYDYESIRLNQRFDAESLAITEGVNKDLMAFVQNQDLKLGLTTEYERRRGQIAEKFALSYVPITEGMTQSEIDGINASIKARDEAFAKLADWQTGQIQFVIDNGKLERDTFTETQKIIADGKEAQYQLSLKYKADEIKNEIDRNAEKDAADAVRRASLIEAEKNYNTTITALNLAKDQAIADSMGRLKNFMITAIDSMQSRYAEMVAKGIEGSEAFLASLNKIKDAYYEIFNTQLPGTNDSRGSDTSKPTVNPTPTNTPRFAKGTDYVDPNDYWPDGTDTVPAMLNKGERVLTSGQNAAIGNMSNEELVRRLTSTYLSPSGTFYPVDRGLVDSISASGVPTMGGLSASMDNGGFSSWVSTNSAARSGGAASGGMGGFANPATRATSAMQGRGESGGDVAGALARNNELMQALVNLVANGTNEELKRIADKPNLTLHDVNLAKDKERDARVVSDF